VVLANAAVDIDYLVHQIVSRSYFTDFQVDPKVLASYAGSYQLGNGNRVTIRVDDSRIFIQVPPEPENELFATDKSLFYLPVSAPGSDIEITFYRNYHRKVDRVVAVVGTLGGVTYEAKKVH
jgi:hypothetical protein